MSQYSQCPQLLLVEDQPSIYLALQRYLKNEGYAVTLATDYQSAYAQLTTQHFHLAIIDVRLSDDEADQSGMQLLRDVERLGLRGVMPCLIITAIGTKTMALQALQKLGAERFIEKEPGLYITELLDAIRVALGKYRFSFGIEYVGQATYREHPPEY